jgi:hypothetical protein
LTAPKENYMKKTFLSLLIASATSVAFGQGQGQLSTTTGATGRTTATTTTTTAAGQIQAELGKPRPPQAAPLVPTEGAVQAAIRTRQPLQMINPAAPAQFGSGQQHTSHDPKNPGKPKGIVLFAWSF